MQMWSFYTKSALKSIPKYDSYFIESAGEAIKIVNIVIMYLHMYIHFFTYI